MSKIPPAHPAAVNTSVVFGYAIKAIIRQLICVSAIVLFGSFASCCAQDSVDESWSHWRGPYQNGTASPNAAPPTTWSETENLEWKTKIPGRGHSTPIVRDGKVFVTTAVPIGEKFAPRKSGRPGAHDNVSVSQKHAFKVLAIQVADGKIAWEKTVAELIPHEGGHHSASLASASPVTDGKYIYAHFGSFGTYCLDYDGNLIWEFDLGDMHSKHGHGEGASPVLSRDKLFLCWDHEEQSFVAAFDKSTGKEVWRKKRDEVTSWSSPVVVNVGKSEQLIVNGTQRIRGYDTATGKVVWECGGLSANVVASPVFDSGILVAGSSYEKQAMLGIKIDDAKGDLTESESVIWKRRSLTPYVPSLLLYDSNLYFLRHYQGVLSRVDLSSGKDNPGPVRLRGFLEIYASPVAADGKIYITDRQGTTAVLDANDYPRTISVNQIDDRVNASLAIVGKRIFIRGEKNLYCFKEKK